MPAGVLGLVTLDELMVLGWDIAVATGQSTSRRATNLALR